MVNWGCQECLVVTQSTLSVHYLWVFEGWQEKLGPNNNQVTFFMQSPIFCFAPHVALACVFCSCILTDLHCVRQDSVMLGAEGKYSCI